MIERQFLAEKIKEYNIQKYIANKLSKAGYVKIEIKKTPLGEKVIIHTTRPGMIVGMKGANIKDLTVILKEEFGMENPQIEVADISNPNLDAASIADRIKFNFERYGPKKFKFLGYETLKNVLSAGALGAEIVISGRGVPSQRSKTWRFSGGYLKKSGDISESKVDKAETCANLKSGTIGIKVIVMHPDLRLPDKVTFLSSEEILSEENKSEEKIKKSKSGKKEDKETVPEKSKKKGVPKEKSNVIKNENKGSKEKPKKEKSPKKEIKKKEKKGEENGNIEKK